MRFIYFSSCASQKKENNLFLEKIDRFEECQLVSKKEGLIYRQIFICFLQLLNQKHKFKIILNILSFFKPEKSLKFSKTIQDWQRKIFNQFFKDKSTFSLTFSQLLQRILKLLGPNFLKWNLQIFSQFFKVLQISF